MPFSLLPCGEAWSFKAQRRATWFSFPGPLPQALQHPQHTQRPHPLFADSGHRHLYIFHRSKWSIKSPYSAYISAHIINGCLPAPFVPLICTNAYVCSELHGLQGTFTFINLRVLAVSLREVYTFLFMLQMANDCVKRWGDWPRSHKSGAEPGLKPSLWPWVQRSFFSPTAITYAMFSLVRLETYMNEGLTGQCWLPEKVVWKMQYEEVLRTRAVEPNSLGVSSAF